MVTLDRPHLRKVCCLARKAWGQGEVLDEKGKALRIILKVEGRLVTGAAGTGKSMIIKRLRTELCERKETVSVCAYTHAAAKLVGGCAIARLLHYKASLHNAWILVDEYSLIPIDTLGQLARLQIVGAKYVLCWGPRGPVRADAR